MNKNENCDKLILAILQGSDYRDAIETLADHGFYATVLQTTGGFLRKQSVTIMVGLNHEYLDEALGLLDRFGKRTETHYQTPSLSAAELPLSPIANPYTVPGGGVVLFVVDVEKYKKY